MDSRPDRPDELQKQHIYYKECTQNLTADNEKDEKRCAQPELANQWGLKFNASDMVGLDAEVGRGSGLGGAWEGAKVQVSSGKGSELCATEIKPSITVLPCVVWPTGCRAGPKSWRPEHFSCTCRPETLGDLASGAEAVWQEPERCWVLHPRWCDRRVEGPEGALLA